MTVFFFFFPPPHSLNIATERVKYCNKREEEEEGPAW